jgi:hypothetical protein
MKRTLPSVAVLALLLSAGNAFAQPAEPEPAPPEPAAPEAPPAEAPPTTPPPETPPPAQPPQPQQCPQNQVWNGTACVPNAATAPTTAPTTAGAGVQADTGFKATTPHAGDGKEEKLVWRGTTFLWDNSATTETVGIGQDTQTENPTYEMTFSLRPRYYFYTDDDQNLSVRAEVGVFREFTNSDTTTERGEWSFADSSLLLAYTRVLASDGDFKTDLSVRAPSLVFPTSKVSANSGRYLSLGASVGGSQQIPILGTKDSDVMQTVAFNGVVGYSHWFSRATTPTNSELDRVRLDPEGRSVPGDQLSSAAFAKHQMTFTVGADLGIHERVTWSNNFSWRPQWKYEFDDNQQICNLSTGCATAGSASEQEPTSHTVITLFESEVSVKIVDELDIAVGYNNLTLQLGANGERRNVFYSPDSRVYLTATAHLDEIYKTATGSGQSAKAPTRRAVAKR